MREIQIKEMKERLLDMLKYLDNLCNENGLSIYIAWGSLLGAVRHKGFIPWDDDIDVQMTRPDYEKLIEIFRQNGNNGRYQLFSHEFNDKYLYTFAKFVDTDTLLIENDIYSGVEMGLYLDIFPIDGLGDDIDKAKKKMKKYDKYLTMNYALLVKPWRKGVSFVKNFAIECFRLLIKMYGRKRLHKKMDRLLKSDDYDGSRYVAQYCAMVSGDRIFNKDEMYGGYELLQFEDYTVKAPKNWDKCLTCAYGDYMQLPPEEKRVYTHGYKLYDKTVEE